MPNNAYVSAISIIVENETNKTKQERKKKENKKSPSILHDFTGSEKGMEREKASISS